MAASDFCSFLNSYEALQVYKLLTLVCVLFGEKYIDCKFLFAVTVCRYIMPNKIIIYL